MLVLHPGTVAVFMDIREVQKLQRRPALCLYYTSSLWQCLWASGRYRDNRGGQLFACTTPWHCGIVYGHQRGTETTEAAHCLPVLYTPSLWHYLWVLRGYQHTEGLSYACPKLDPSFYLPSCLHPPPGYYHTDAWAKTMPVASQAAFQRIFGIHDLTPYDVLRSVLTFSVSGVYFSYTFPVLSQSLS